MAGTAAGARKARARMIEKAGIAVDPAIFDQQSGQQPETVIIDGQQVISPNSDEPGSMLATLDQSNHALTIEAFEPPALQVVRKVLNGQLRVPASVRVSTALHIIDLAEARRNKPGSDAIGPSADLLAKLANSLALRRRTVEAVPAQVVERGVSGGDVVDAIPAAHSEKQPDS